MRPAICGKASLAACCLALLTAASGDDGPVVEMSNAFIASRDEERLHVVISVENPGAEPATLLLQVEDGAGRSLNGKIAIAPVSTGDLALWIEAPSPRAMGMIAGPSLAAAGLETGTLPVTATEGSIDASRVASVRLGIARPSAPREIVVGPWRVMPPSETDRTAYQGIVDGFGQFRPGRWPEKMSSAEMLRARGAEEVRELARRFALNPERDRFGGLFSGQTFGASGFFRTERRDGRWWLVTPEGHGFFSLGVDAVAPSV